jgi:Caspase domain
MVSVRAFAMAVILSALSAVSGSAAAQGQRHALLIGVNDYREITKLERAVGDAQAMGTMLQSFGFNVQLALNPTRRELNEAISRFIGRLQPEDTAFVHFSGHGLEIQQQNFLLPADMPQLPVDIGAAASEFVRGEAVSLSDLMSRVANSPAKIRIFVIDACRDNPLAARGVRGAGATRGLNVKEAAPDGTFVFYSAGAGQQALDKLSNKDIEPTSVYTRVLLKHMRREGPVVSIAQNVRRDVRDMAKRVNHLQAPAYYDEFIGSNEYYLDPMKDPRRGWKVMCEGPKPQVADGGWVHNGQRFTLVADGTKRRLHYVEPRKVVRDHGVTPNCVLVDGEIKDGKLVAKAHIYREACGMFAYDVEGVFADGSERIELKGAAPIPAEDCRIVRLDEKNPNSVLVFEKWRPEPVVVVPAPAPAPGQAPVLSPVAPPSAVR